MALIPSERLVDWTIGTHVGVIGGIPSRTTVYDDDGNGITESLTLIDDTGATDVKAAIQAAIDACPIGECVVMPDGNFRIDSTLNMGTGFSGKTFRGQGETTIIEAHCNEAINSGSSAGYDTPGTPLIVSAGLTKGSTEITITEDHTWIPVGSLVLLMVEADDTIPVVSVYGYNIQTNQGTQGQVVRITARAGDDIEFWPPLFSDYGGGSLEVRMLPQTFSASGIGLEDFTVDCTPYTGGGGITGSFSGVKMAQCYNSWITGVKSIQAWNYGIIVANCLNCDFRTLWGGELKGGGSNGAGLLFTAHSCLVEDGIFVDAFPNIEINSGAAGNLFLYSFGDAMCDTNHAPHNQFNLFEGNAFGYIMSDGYFGSSSDETVSRSYLHDSSFGNFHMRRFTRRASVVGCLIANDAIASQGYPNIGNTDSMGTAEYPSDPWRDWAMTGELTTRTNDTDGVITLASGLLYGGSVQVIRLVWGAGLDQQRFATPSSVAGDEVTIANYNGGTVLPAEGTIIHIGPGSYFGGPGIGSYQELDEAVAPTVIDKGNYYIDGGTTSPLGGDALPNSLCGDSKAESEARGVDWGAKTWPPFDGGDPSTASVARIPAGQRYIDSLPPSAPEILNDPDETIFLEEEWSLQIVTDVPADDGFTATDLPGWMTLDEDTGLITGTPVEGVYEFTLHATNAIGTGDLPMTLTVRETRRAVITPVGGGHRHGPTTQGAFVLI